MGKYVFLWAHTVEARHSSHMSDAFHAHCATNQCTHIGARAKFVTILLHYRLIPYCRDYVRQLNGQITFHLSRTHSANSLAEIERAANWNKYRPGSELLRVRTTYGVGAGWYNVWHCTHNMYGCFPQQSWRGAAIWGEAMASHFIWEMENMRQQCWNNIPQDTHTHTQCTSLAQCAHRTAPEWKENKPDWNSHGNGCCGGSFVQLIRTISMALQPVAISIVAFTIE